MKQHFLKFAFVLFLTCLVKSAYAGFPFAPGECPRTAAQTWQDADEGKANLDAKNAVKNAYGGNEIGFLEFGTNNSKSCSNNTQCVNNSQLVLSTPPTFPNLNSSNTDKVFDSNDTLSAGNYKSVEIKDGADVTFTGTEYHIQTLKIASDGSQAIFQQPTILYVETLLLEDKASIKTKDDDPENLIIVAIGGSAEITLKPKNSGNGANSIRAHIISQNKISLEEKARAFGTLTANNLNIQGNASISSDLPEKCDSQVPEYSTNAEWEMGVVECGSEILTTGCSIPITGDYKYTPLVFVMPTVRENSPDFDAPSRLYISSALDANSSSVTVKQESLPGLRSSYSTVQMTSVSYFIMEPGVAELDGEKVVAGYVNTRQIAKHGSNPPNFATGAFSTFGLTSFSSAPVVIHQLQTNHNYDKWMTSGHYYNSSTAKEEANLYIELSNSFDNKHTYASEKIAFIASDASNVLDTAKGKVQFGTFDVVAQNGTFSSLYDGCENSEVEVDFKLLGIIGKKQSRVGSDGGWLRRCKLENDDDEGEATFVIDEDKTQRSHLKEPGGYLAFGETQTVLPELCDYFSEPVQTWSSSGAINLESSNIRLRGWSPDYQLQYGIDQDNDNVLEGLILPFQTTNSDNATYHLRESCEVKDESGNTYIADCELGSSGIDQPPFTPEPYELLPTWGTETLELDQWNMSRCDNSSACSYTESGSDIFITISSSLQKLKVSSYNSKKLHVTFSATPGLYGISIKEYTSGGAATTIFEGDSSYTIGTLLFEGTNATILHGKGVILNIIDKYQQDNPVKVHDNEEQEDLIYYGPKAEFIFKNNADNDIYLRVLGSKVHFQNKAIVRGAVTSNNLIMDVSESQIISSGYCSTAPDEPEVANIEIKPKNYHLTCEVSPANQVEVHMFDELGEPITPDTMPSLSQVGGTNLQVSDISMADGVALYQVTTSTQNSVGSYNVKAELVLNNGSTIESQTETVKYVPYRFSVDEQRVIAGQSVTAIPIKVEACNGSNQLIELGYTGTPTATFSYEQPSGLAVDADDLDFTSRFDSDDNLVADLTFQESGYITVSIEDEAFECDEEFCPVDGGSLKGEFELYSRPWKIAICNVHEAANSSNLNPQTTSSGSGFMTAGNTFNVTYRPIVYGSAGSQCSLAITENYALDSGPLELTHAVNYPATNSVPGIITPSVVPSFGQVAEYMNTDGTMTIPYTWSEVGSIEFTTNATYLSEALDSDSQTIGRFYPALFQVTGTPVWQFENSRFAYMNQPFEGVEFQVEALSGGTNPSRVLNYDTAKGYSQTASFSLFESDSAIAARLNVPTFGADWTEGVGTFSWSNTSNSINCATTFCWQKAAVAAGYEDGPYNSGSDSTNISITATGIANTDPVAINSAQQELNTQPDIRFGRVRIDSAGGQTSNQISVPLQIQFWNGARFEVDEADNTTDIQGAESGSDNTIWVEEGATPADVTLSAGGAVSSGVSNSIVASQASAVRQQTQVWLDLDDYAWFRYHWDDNNATDDSNGEQDPSSVITFGIYRGNDRVIFRGEPGLTGQ